MDLVKKLKVFHVFVLGILGQEKVFHDILERKNAFVERKKGAFFLSRISSKHIFLAYLAKNTKVENFQFSNHGLSL